MTGDGKTLWAEMSASRTLVGEDRSEVVGVVRDVSKRKAAEAEQLRMASTDVLTCLPNRAALAERARRTLGAGERFSLVLMDLDSFKDVNDTLGHQVGDQVLVAVAARLAANVREGDFLARLGGDEFAVVVPEAGVKAREIARRLLGALDGRRSRWRRRHRACQCRAGQRARGRLRRRHLVAQGRVGHVLGKGPR